MLYVTTGNGGMPPKEAVSVLTQLLENEERKAVEQGLPDVSFWLAVDPYFINTDNAHWQAVEKWCSENEIYVEESENIYNTVRDARAEGEDVAILTLPVSPYFTHEQDAELRQHLLTVKDAFPEVPIWAFNNQMYEVLPSSHPEPEELPKPFHAGVDEAVEDALNTLAESGKVVVKDGSDDVVYYNWSAAELEAKSRDDLKDLAKKMSVVPKDWRSKDSIIEAVLGKLDDIRAQSIRTFDTPIEDEVQEPADTDGSAPNATGVAMSEAELERLVEDVVKRVLQSILTEALTRSL